MREGSPINGLEIVCAADARSVYDSSFSCDHFTVIVLCPQWHCDDDDDAMTVMLIMMMTWWWHIDRHRCAADSRKRVRYCWTEQTDVGSVCVPDTSCDIAVCKPTIQ